MPKGVPRGGKRERKAHYCLHVATGVCERIAMGMSLEKALKADPKAPVKPRWFHWLREHPELEAMYEQARLLSADSHADKLLDYVDDAVKDPKAAPGYKVAADILKWTAEVRNPEKYGKKLELGRKANLTDPDKIRAEIQRLEKELGIKTIGMSDGKQLDVPSEHEHVFVDTPPDSPPE